MDYPKRDKNGQHIFEGRPIMRAKPQPQDTVGQQRYQRLLDRGYGVNKTVEEQREQKRQEAEIRQTRRDALTPQQQIAKLDAKLGVGQGATRERARLAREIADAVPSADEGKKQKPRKKKASNKKRNKAN